MQTQLLPYRGSAVSSNSRFCGAPLTLLRDLQHPSLIGGLHQKLEKPEAGLYNHDPFHSLLWPATLIVPLLLSLLTRRHCPPSLALPYLRKHRCLHMSRQLVLYLLISAMVMTLSMHLSLHLPGMWFTSLQMLLRLQDFHNYALQRFQLHQCRITLHRA